MYYKISPSSDPAVIGDVNSQAETSVYPDGLSTKQPASTFLYKMAPDEGSVYTPKPILVPNAILTDLISGTAIGNTMQLMISDLLKSILYEHNHIDLQYFPMSVIYKKVELKNFWLTNPFHFRQELIDYANSDIELNGAGGIFIKAIKVSDIAEFNRIKEALELPERLFIKNVRLQNNIQTDFFLLRGIDGGVGYFISEKVKWAIEEAGCTGIEFLEIE